MAGLTPEAVFAMLKRYVADTAIGLGAVKGAPCTIKSIEEKSDHMLVTFEWTATTGKKVTSEMKVPIGKGGSGTYTNPGVGRAVGGVPLGYVFKDTPVNEVFDKIFEAAYTKPTISIGLNPQNNLYSQNDPSSWPKSVIVTANVGKKTNPITKVVWKINGTVVNTLTTGVADGGQFKFTCPALEKTTTYVVECSDGISTVSSQTVVTIIGNSYSGYIAENQWIDDVNPSNLTPNLKTSKAFSYTSSFPDDGNTYRIVYMYPKSLGALTSITDNMGFPNLDEYTRFEKKFDNIDYYVYIAPASGVSGLIQNYS